MASWDKTDWDRINAICSIILATVAIAALVASIIFSISSYKLSKQVIDMTSPKYAYITPELTYWSGNTSYMPLSDTNNSEVNYGYTQVDFNIMNTGQSNTGQVQVSERPELNSDQTFTLNPIEIRDIAKGNNQDFTLNFSVANYSTVLGLHQINLGIYCENCFEQNSLIIKTIYVCVYNDSKYSGHDNWLKVVDSGCKQFN